MGFIGLIVSPIPERLLIFPYETTITLSNPTTALTPAIPGSIQIPIAPTGSLKRGLHTSRSQLFRLIKAVRKVLVSHLWLQIKKRGLSCVLEYFLLAYGLSSIDMQY